MGAITIDMSRYTGISSRYTLVPMSMSNKEYIDYNIVYETKTVIDGHTSGAFAALTISSIIIGIVIGLASVSSLFQITILGIQVPRPF